MLTETISRLATASRSAIRTYKGIGVSPGIAIGRAVIIERREAAIYRVPIRDDEVPSEVNRFLEALDKTQAQLQDGLNAMQALLRAHLRDAQAEAGTELDLDPLVAMLFGASVAIRVLGRAGQDRRLLQDIAKGAIEAARRCFERDRSNQT